MTKFSKLVTGFALGLLVLLTIAASIDYRALNVTQFSAVNTVSIISGAPLTNSFIKDLTGVLSLGATARLSYNSLGVKSVDWENNTLWDAGIASITWGARVMRDSANVVSEDWEGRTLKDAAGATSLSWGAKTFTGSSWIFLSITNHSDVSAGTFASGNVWGYNGVTGNWTNGPPGVATPYDASKTTTNTIALTLRDPMIGDGNNGAATTNKTAFLNLFGNGALLKLSTNDASSLTNFALLTNSITATFDGGGATVQTNITRLVVVPYNGTITEFTMTTDTTSLTVLDIMRFTYAQYDASATHPAVGDSIVASLPPTIGTSLYKTNTTVGTWSTSLTNNTYLAFRTITNTAATWINLTLKVTHALQP